MSNNQQLAKINRQSNPLSNVSMTELKEMGEMFFASQMFPDLKTAAQAMVKIHAGAELGFSPIVSMTGIHFFQGKTVIGANLQASLIKDSGKYEYEIMEHTDKTCTIQMKHLLSGRWEKMGVPVTYTIAEAQTAGLTTKDVWKKYPKDMLFAAVIRQACRRYCADVLRGMSVEHENFAEQQIDTVDVQAAHEEAQPSVDGEIVEEAPAEDAGESLRAEIQQIASELNAAKDKVLWSPAKVKEYAEEHFGEEYEGLEPESLVTLRDDLAARLKDLKDSQPPF